MSYTYSLYPKIPSDASNPTFYVFVRGYNTNPDTGKSEYTAGNWEFFDLKGEGETPKPSIDVPEKLEKGKDFQLTMPDETDVVYRPVLVDSAGRTAFELKRGKR